MRTGQPEIAVFGQTGQSLKTRVTFSQREGEVRQSYRFRLETQADLVG